MKNKMKIAVLITLIFLLLGCQSNSENQQSEELNQTIQLVVTTDFGRDIIFNQEVEFDKGDTVMTVLASNLDVETKYNGTFVNGINGVESTFNGKNDQQADWFFYINGVSADVGANEYQLMNQDQVWWDYHQWGKGLNISSVTGQFPEPFVNGYKQSTKQIDIVAINENYFVLKKYFEGLSIEIVEKKLVEYDYSKAENPAIIMLKTEDIKTNSIIEDINNNFDKAGFFAQIEQNEIVLYNQNYEEIDRIMKNGVAVQSFSTGLGSSKPIWLIIGQDEEALNRAVTILTQETEKIQWMNSFAIKGEEILRLPMK